MYKHFIKPVADRILALCLLLLFAPVMLLTALMVRIKLGKPLLFSQERPGLHGNVFRVYKFRSMSDARDATGELLPDDIRLGHFGKLLRSTSLDELPQLWNVLKGDMSFIGPRPLLVEYLPLYNAFQRRRHEVRPGITGWAQVNGRNAITWDERFVLDVWYVDHVSLWTDIRIVVMTIYKIFRRDGVSQGGHVTMPRFMGNENKGASNDTIA